MCFINFLKILDNYLSNITPSSLPLSYPPGTPIYKCAKTFHYVPFISSAQYFFFPRDSVWLFSLGPTLSPPILSSAAPGELLDLAREVFNIRHNIFRFQNI